MKKKDKKLLYIKSYAFRDMRHEISGRFFSAHKEKDIRKWLEHKKVTSSNTKFENLFTVAMRRRTDFNIEPIDDQLHDSRVEVSEVKNPDVDPSIHYFDDEIQKFLDKESK